MKYLKAFLLFITLISGYSAYNQVFGCRDPLANNYNAFATVNDGSCIYNLTNYSPTIKVPRINDVLRENSGLQWDGKNLWTFNDGGGTATIYKIDTASNSILQTVTLAGATNVDWEDIAFDGTYLYLGDFGNNANGARADLKIYKLPLSTIPDHTVNSNFTVPANSINIINFSYSDQPRPLVAVSSNSTRYDCEAMIVDEGKVHLFTKNWVNNNTTHYVINSTLAGTYVAAPLEVLETGYLVTGADKAPGSKVIALLGYQPISPANHFMHLFSDYKDGRYFNGNKRTINLPNAIFMGQGEGITFRNNTFGYISNERLSTAFGTINPMLHSFDVNSFVPSYVLPVKISGLKASVEYQNVKLVWTTKTEANIDRYEVERQVGNAQFTRIGTIIPTISGALSKTYNWVDSNGAKGNNVYRIKVVEKSGNFFFSELVKVRLMARLAFSVSPNPVKSHNLVFRYSFPKDEKYSIALYNSNGQNVFRRNVALSINKSTETLRLPDYLLKGSYFLIVRNLGGIVAKQSLVIE